MKFNNIGMGLKRLQKHDFPEGTLSISLISKGVEDFFHSHHFPGSSVYGLPHYAVCAFAQPLLNVKPILLKKTKLIQKITLEEITKNKSYDDDH